MFPRIALVALLALLLSVFCVSSRGSSLEESIFNLGPRLFDHFLLETPRQDVPKNFIASPLGLGLGLGLLETAAPDDLRKLIGEVFFDWKQRARLDLQGNLTQIQRAIKGAYQQESNLNTSAVEDKKDSSLQDVIVNLQCAIFHNKEVVLTKEFLTVVKDQYESEVIVFDRSLNTTDPQQVVNKWAANATHGLITEFPVPAEFKMLLANTVYFQGDWVDPFSHEYTRKSVFKPNPSDNRTFIQDVQYLQGQKDDLPYYEDSLFQMIKLPYVTKNSSDVAMYVLLPQKDKLLRDVINQVSFANFRDILEKKMELHIVNVKIPKVTLQHKIDVKKVMDSYQDKMNRRWERDVAAKEAVNATKMEDIMQADKPDDFELTEFVHNTVLEVNEKGTKAASITAGTINYDSLKKRFRCDHPYLMIIYDNVNHVVLFWAAVYDPTSQ